MLFEVLYPSDINICSASNLYKASSGWCCVTYWRLFFPHYLSVTWWVQIIFSEKYLAKALAKCLHSPLIGHALQFGLLFVQKTCMHWFKFKLDFTKYGQFLMHEKCSLPFQM